MQPRQLFTGSITTFITRVSTFALNFATLIIITRILGPKNVGLYALITLIPMTLSSLGTPALNLSNVYLVGKGTYDLKSISGLSFAAAAIFTLVLTGLIFLASFFPQFGQFLQAKEIEVYDMWLAVAALPAYLVFRWYSGILRGAGKIIQFNFVTFLSVAFQFLIVVVLWFFSNVTLTTVLWSFVLSTALVALVTFGMTIRITSISFRWDALLLKEMFNYGSKAYLWNAIYFLDNRSMLLVIGLMISAVQLGFYSTAAGLTEKMWFITEAVATVLFPFVSSGKKSGKDDVRVTAAICRYIFYLMIVLSLILGVLAGPLIQLMFGSAYMDAVRPFQILLGGVAMLSVARLITIDYAARGKPEIGTLSALVEFGVSMILLVILISRFGINGVAFATSAGYIAAALTMLFLFSRKHQISPFFVLIPEREDWYNLKKMVSLITTGLEVALRASRKGLLRTARK